MFENVETDNNINGINIYDLIRALPLIQMIQSRRKENTTFVEYTKTENNKLFMFVYQTSKHIPTHTLSNNIRKYATKYPYT